MDDVNKQLYITETEKIHARLHEISKDLLKGLLNQRIIVQDVTMACENEKDVLLRLSSRSMKNVEQNKNALNSSNNPLLSTLNENVYNVDGGGSTMSGLNLDVNANSAVLNAAYDPT